MCSVDRAMFILFNVLLFSSFSLVNCYDCMNIDNFRTLLGSKTPYRFIKNANDSRIDYDACEATHMVVIIRHGTRTPSHAIISEMKTVLPFLQKQMFLHPVAGLGVNICQADKNRLMAWKYDIANDTDEKLLTHEGENEMLGLAKRFQNRFPSLLHKEYSNTSFYFRFTATERTEHSARSFSQGLFGEKSDHVWFPESVEGDPILRFYKRCKKWKLEVKKNATARVEYTKYFESEEMRDVAAEVSERLGLNITLSLANIALLYSVCTFETSWNKNQFSPWCSIFSLDNMKVLDYAQDIKLFWRDGYGYEINYKQACPIIENVFSILNGEDEKAVFYFTHSGTVLKTLSHLGLYRDSKPLTHDLPAAQRNMRQWRTAAIDAFASNLAFVRFKCSSEDQVLFLHQERPVRIPGCPESDLCPMDVLRKLFSQSISCDFDKRCSLNSD